MLSIWHSDTSTTSQFTHVTLDKYTRYEIFLSQPCLRNSDSSERFARASRTRVGDDGKATPVRDNDPHKVFVFRESHTAFWMEEIAARL